VLPILLFSGQWGGSRIRSDGGILTIMIAPDIGAVASYEEVTARQRRRSLAPQRFKHNRGQQKRSPGLGYRFESSTVSFVLAKVSLLKPHLCSLGTLYVCGPVLVVFILSKTR
jgi:hypothetical protein